MCITQNELTAAINMVIAESNQIQTAIQRGVHDYLEIQRLYDANQIDNHFRDVFSSFYCLRLAFGHLNEGGLWGLIQSRQVVPIDDAIRRVANPGGRNAFISFASKTLHTIDNNLPIIDNYVYDFLEINRPNADNLNGRIQQCEEIYRVLCNFYTERNENGLVRLAETFNQIYPNIGNQISDVKKIDFMIWGFGRL